MKIKELPPLELLNEYFEIDLTCSSGLRWKTRKYAGQEAGTLNSVGYFTVSINKSKFLIHRIIYALINQTCDFNDMLIDHIDRNKSNNTPSNLRLVDYIGNARNKPSRSETGTVSRNSTTGIPNINKNSRFGWCVKFQENNCQKQKYFADLNEAIFFQKSLT